MKLISTIVVLTLWLSTGRADQPVVLFDGQDLDQWEFRPGGWVIDEFGALTRRMEQVKRQDDQQRPRGMGYIWTRKNYDNFVLTLSYKLSVGANSGVFYRTDPDNPVQGGFEIQLLDDEGFQKLKGKKDPQNLNGAIYDCQGPSVNSAKPVGQWNALKLTCNGPQISVDLNNVRVNEVNIDRWDTPRKNPDGSPNKFKTALKELPRTGRIGLQNHGQVVWFRDVTIRPLP